MEHFVKMMILEIAHICDIWAWIGILLSVAVIFALVNLQGVCIKRIGICRVIGDQLSVISDAGGMKLANKGVSCE